MNLPQAYHIPIVMTQTPTIQQTGNQLLSNSTNRFFHSPSLGNLKNKMQNINHESQPIQAVNPVSQFSPIRYDISYSSPQNSQTERMKQKGFVRQHQQRYSNEFYTNNQKKEIIKVKQEEKEQQEKIKITPQQQVSDQNNSIELQNRSTKSQDIDERLMTLSSENQLQFQQQIERLEFKIAKLTEDNRQLANVANEDKDKFIRQINQLVQNNQRANIETQEHKKLLEQANQKYLQQLSDKKKLIAEFGKKEKQMNKAYQDHAAALTQEIIQLKQTITQQQSQLEMSKNESILITNDQRQSQEAFIDLQRKFEILLDENQKLNEALTDSIRATDEQKNQINNLMNSIAIQEQEKGKLQNMVESVSERLQQVLNSYESLQQQLVEMNAIKEMNTKLIEEHQQSQLQLKEQQLDCEDEMKSSKYFQQKLATAENERSELQSQKIKTEEQMVQYQQLIEQLKDEKAEFEKQLASKNNQQGMEEEEQKKVQQVKMDEMQKETRSLKKLINELQENFSDGLQEYEVQLNAEREGYLFKITDLGDKLSLLTNELERITILNEKLSAENDERVKEREKLKKSIMEHEKHKMLSEEQLNKLREKIAAEAEAHKQLSNELVTLKKRNENLQQIADKSQNDLNYYVDQINLQKESNEKLMDQISALNCKLLELQQTIKVNEETINKKQLIIEHMSLDIKDFQKEKEELVKVVEETQQRFEARNKDVLKECQQIAQIREQYLIALEKVEDFEKSINEKLKQQ